MKRWNSQGQMYLIAVIIIIAMVGGMITVMNYSRKEQSPNAYRLGEELGIEASSLLDYSLINGSGKEQTLDLMENFISNYTLYGNIQELYFIYGQEGGAFTFLGYSEKKEKEVIIKLNETDPGTLILINPNDLEVEEFGGAVGDTVKIITEDSTYEFLIRQGESFYFVLSQEISEEKFVYQGGSRDD